MARRSLVRDERGRRGLMVMWPEDWTAVMKSRADGLGRGVEAVVAGFVTWTLMKYGCIPAVAAVTAEMLEGYLLQQLKEGSPKAVARQRNALVRLFAVADGEGIHVPAVLTPASRLSPPPLSPTEMGAIEGALVGRADLLARLLHPFLWILMTVPISANKLAALPTRFLDGRDLYFLDGRGRQMRLYKAVLTDYLYEAMSAYKAAVNVAGLNACFPLWVNGDGKQFHPDGYRKSLHRLAVRAEVGGPIVQRVIATREAQRLVPLSLRAIDWPLITVVGSNSVVAPGQLGPPGAEVQTLYRQA